MRPPVAFKAVYQQYIDEDRILRFTIIYASFFSKEELYALTKNNSTSKYVQLRNVSIHSDALACINDLFHIL
jgi:hypothetical protein